MGAPLLQTLELSCERDQRVLVDKLTLSVAEGDIVQIEGPNGSGKTTLMRVLAGLSRRCSGEIRWRGATVLNAGGRINPEVHATYVDEMLYLGHAQGLKLLLTPRENLQWLCAMRGAAVLPATIDSALDRVGLYGYEDAPCHTLSAGQQRRVNLARLLVVNCSLWLLDEPFTAIDKRGVAELEGLLADHARAGGAVVLTTHHSLAIDHPLQRVALGD